MHMRSHSTRVLTWTFSLRRQGPQGELQRVSLLGAMRDDELGEVRGLEHFVDDKVHDVPSFFPLLLLSQPATPNVVLDVTPNTFLVFLPCEFAA